MRRSLTWTLVWNCTPVAISKLTTHDKLIYEEFQPIWKQCWDSTMSILNTWRTLKFKSFEEQTKLDEDTPRDGVLEVSKSAIEGEPFDDILYKE
ncbi:hypothetical protein KI387_038868, partial [Taxus chinensis]